jgi:L,D-peptidoglycan transpeptidase YkuD (ErfK/YbiS/YcfS/YnhG family)
LESEIIDQATYQRIIKNPAHPPQTTAMGGLIYIHGGGVGSDWTWGCIAVENTVMDYLFAESSVGTTIAIVPSLQAMAF